MERRPEVYVIGEGVADPKGIFGTTTGLLEKFGRDRVIEMPVAENGLTGVAIGTALVGQRPVMIHQRVDFALLAVEQLFNNAAKTHYVTGGKHRVPLTLRLVIGRGWGQGPQHSQCLEPVFSHIPGLKVVMPSTPYDAKGLLMAAVADGNPVIYVDDRWLYADEGPVPEEMYEVPISVAAVRRPGRDVTIVAASFMAREALRAAVELAARGIDAEVIDLRSLKPWDRACVLESVEKTGRLVIADSGWTTAGVGAEIAATVAEERLRSLKAPVARVCLPDIPAPMSRALEQSYYRSADDITAAALKVLGR
jgi:acetoin:2,6-dichlorophenolindophenol oxidoreductase subunit beta